jgi:hypothetical protein
MLKRCYSSKSNEARPTYIGATVCNEWLNFQVFAKWFDRYHPTDGLKYEIDKDMLKGDNGIYSPKTCIFIPGSLNNFMANNKSNNKSGYTGVSWDNSRNRWVVRISMDGGDKYLGLYKDKLEASKVYNEARKEQINRWQRYYSFDLPKIILDRLG